MKITDEIKKRRLYFDGGTGTLLQAQGLAPGELPEAWNVTHPEKIIALHRAYLTAGADIIKTNTFGAAKGEVTPAMIKAGIQCAKRAVSEFPGRYVAFDLGPTGKMLAPLGDLAFEEAVALFAENIRFAVQCGVDLILIETMSDSYETKAAVLAAKENAQLPVFVTNAFDETGKLMTGASPEAMIALLEGLGVDAIGMNCSFGPDKMLELVEEYQAYSSLPVIVNPNAGMPRVENGRTVYDIHADDFAGYMAAIAQKGGCILGGCCGTTPEYIQKTVEKTREIPYVYPEQKNFTVISSYAGAVRIGEGPVLIGERINPTGKPKLKEALRQENIGYILNEGIKQAEAGVQVLDVNVGLPEIDEAKLMGKAVQELQAVCELPLQIDSSDAAVLEKAMRLYNGKPLVNSVNGKLESMEQVFPLIKKYGGVLIALTIDEAGIPGSAEGRFAIAQKILHCAAEYGIAQKDIVVDPLALTVSSDPLAAQVTMESIKMLSAAGFRTSLGVSNISFGLPARDVLNAAFFSGALYAGLDCAIMNPFSLSMMNTYYAFRALTGLDQGCGDYIENAVEISAQKTEKTAAEGEKSDGLQYAVIKGMSEQAAVMAEALCETMEPIDIINREIIPALNQVGECFEKKTLYLPQLLMSAEAASHAFEQIKKKIPASSGQEHGKQRKVILATVKGDIHDIGKNIVKVLLESYGFTVIDLGRDVPPEEICAAVRREQCYLVGLSALMTTTVPSMAETIRQLREMHLNVKVMVGGAVLNEEYAQMIGADKYSPDAMGSVRYAEDFYTEEG